MATKDAVLSAIILNYLIIGNYFKLYKLSTGSKLLGFPHFAVSAFKRWSCLKIYERKSFP